VEAVEHVDGRRASLAHDVQKRPPHVARDEHDRLRALFAQHVEEGVEGAHGAVASDVQQATASVVDLIDEREVLVPLFPGQFVDPDGADAVETSVSQSPSHGVLDASEHGVPTGLKPPCHLLPRQHLRPAREKPDQGMRRLHLALGPRHRLDGDAAARAVHPAHGIDQEDG
jgi:hypothetical protein